jgi:hypothetical protein
MTEEERATHLALRHGTNDPDKIACAECNKGDIFLNVAARTLHYKRCHPHEYAHTCAVCARGVMTSMEVYSHISVCAHRPKKRSREAIPDDIHDDIRNATSSVIDDINAVRAKVARIAETPRQTLGRLRAEELSLRTYITSVLLAHQQIVEQVHRAELIVDALAGDDSTEADSTSADSTRTPTMMAILPSINAAHADRVHANLTQEQ